ncbi:MAG: nucleotidyltransferase substrate binding protein [Candidatus Gastranaerophilales bacterium]|nr:nucleotidyltransferase substrate binding protein [Candidatus Gastranaerophilales bacterium]
MEKIDITSLKKAHKSLNEVIDIYLNDKLNSIVKDSMIQRFEYTYSIALKIIKRYFSKSAFILDNIEDMSFNDMIRNASKMGLLKSNLEKWTIFRQKRNLTSHTYDEKTANDVISIIEDFSSEIEFLIAQLESKIL